MKMNSIVSSSSIDKDMKKNQNQIHVFMVSFPGQGHVNPLLRLGKHLASSGIFVTLAAPEFIGQSIRKANNITNLNDPTPIGSGFLQFQFFDDGWDFNNPNRNDLDAYLTQLELTGREKLPQIIKKQEEKSTRVVSCIISNPFIPWVTDLAYDLGIPSAMLWIQSCACFSAYYHYYNKIVPFPNENEPELDVQIPFMPLLKFDEVPSFLHPGTPYPFLGRAILGQFKNLSKPFCILIDTFQELEQDIVQYMMSKFGLPIKTIGPLFMLTKNNDQKIRGDIYTAESCNQWLDSKQEGTVVYISFGSVVTLKQEQVDEIAYGLLSSDVHFLWVLRPPPKETNFKEHVLPKGFLEKVGDKGKVVKWSSQEEVLAHTSIACFMTHCGWNSTIEALANGVPVLAFPQWGDQVTDAKYLVDVFKTGIRMCRGEAEGRIVNRSEVESCLRAAVDGPEGVEMKANAIKWKKLANEALAEGGSSTRNMDEFVNHIVQMGQGSLSRKIGEFVDQNGGSSSSKNMDEFVDQIVLKGE